MLTILIGIIGILVLVVSKSSPGNAGADGARNNDVAILSLETGGSNKTPDSPSPSPQTAIGYDDIPTLLPALEAEEQNRTQNPTSKSYPDNNEYPTTNRPTRNPNTSPAPSKPPTHNPTTRPTEQPIVTNEMIRA